MAPVSGRVYQAADLSSQSVVEEENRRASGPEPNSDGQTAGSEHLVQWSVLIKRGPRTGDVEGRLAHVVRSNRPAAVAQPAEDVHASVMSL